MFEPHSELPQYLYKYSSVEAIRAMLENGTVMFSNPSLFNDDFDMNLNLEFNVDEELVRDASIERMWSMLNDAETEFADNAVGQALKEMRPSFAGSRDLFTTYMEAGLRRNFSKLPAQFSELSARIASITARLRVFCLSSSGEIAPMWGLYAQNIQGAVLCFSPNSSTSIFLNAFPMKYVPNSPNPLNNETAVGWLSGEKALHEFFDPKMFVTLKHSDWEFEREWRLLSEKVSSSEREFVPFDPIDLHSVIFGMRANSAFIDEICDLVEERYPSAKLQKLKRSRYGLQYEIVDL